MEKLSIIARVIADNVSCIDEVSFSSMSDGSLCKKISRAIKQKNSTLLRDNLKNRWRQGDLKTEVVRLLQQRILESPRMAPLLGGSDFLLRNDYEIVRNQGKGSCFYRAISQAFFDNEEEHLHIRHIITDYVGKNFKNLLSKLRELNYENAERYVTASKYRLHHSSESTFATPFEIYVFVEIFNVAIRVYYKDTGDINNHKLILQFPHDNFENLDDCIHLLFSGPFECGHFELAKKVNSKKLFLNLPQNFSFKKCPNKPNCPFNTISHFGSNIKFVDSTFNSKNETDDLESNSDCNNKKIDAISNFNSSKETINIIFNLKSDKKTIDPNFDSQFHNKHIDAISDSNSTKEIIDTNSNNIIIDNSNEKVDIINKNSTEKLAVIDSSSASDLNNSKDHLFTPHNDDFSNLNCTHETYGEPRSTYSLVDETIDEFDTIKSTMNSTILDNNNPNDDNNDEFDCNNDNNNVNVDRSTSFSPFVSDSDRDDSLSTDKNNDPDNSKEYIFQTSDDKPQTESKDNNDNNEDPQKTKPDKTNKASCKRNITQFPYSLGEFSFLTERVAVSHHQMSIDLLREIIKQYMRTELGCYCPLRFYGGCRKNSDSSVGYAECTVRSHGARYLFQVIERDAEYIQVDVSCNMDKNFVHIAHKEPYTQVRGERRKQLHELTKYRPSRSIYLENCKLSAEELDREGYTNKEFQLHTIHKINSERKVMHRKKLKSLDIQDFVQEWLDDDLLKDKFVQLVQFPLSIIMFTERQLEVINPATPAIVHLDSTGANLKVPGDLNSKRVYYYALVYKATKSTIPLAQMITGDQDEPSITNFLRLHAKKVRNSFSTWPIKAVVVDWSWPSMHSILGVYNNMTISEYLEVTYDYYVDNKKKPRNITYILSCCAHIMHRVADKIKELSLENVKAYLMEFVGKLILCRTRTDMDQIFELIAEILLTKKQDTANNAMEKLGKKFADKEDEVENVKNSGITIDPDKLGNNSINLKVTNSIFSKSPFYIHFGSSVEKIQTQINSIESITTEIDNIYYSPEFLQWLLEALMAYASLWSGIMLDLVDKNVSRVTNAYVESHNKTYKEIILQNRKDMTIGEVIRALRASNDLLLKEEYLFKLRADDNEHITKYPPTKEPAADHTAKEIWARSKKEYDLVKPKRPRNRYISGKNIINISKKISESKAESEGKKGSEDKNEPEEKVNTEDTCAKKSRKRTLKSNEDNEKKVKRNKNNTVVVTESCNVLKFLDNGLVDDIKYYIKSNSPKLQFAHYSADEEIFFYLKRFTLSPLQFHSVTDFKEWIDGQVIDAFASTFMKEWRDITYIPTDLLNKVLGRFSRIETVYKSSIHTYNQKIGDKLLLPYCYDSHWRVLVVDAKSKQLILLDPRLVSSDSGRIKQAFTTFVNDCAVLSPFRKFKDVDWVVNTGPQKRPYQPRNDSENCGVYCIYYLQCIYDDLPFDEDFDPKKFREKIAYQLIQKADDAKKLCLFCARILDPTSTTITCIICKRQVHEDCKTTDGCSSDNENTYEIQRQNSRKRKKIARQASNLSTYTCRLCKLYIT